MERTSVSLLKAQIGATVRISGWIETVRNQKKHQFVILRDRSGKVQLFHERQEGDDSIATTIAGMTPESTIEVVGKVVSNEIVKLGQIEVVVDSIIVHSLAEPQLPINEESSMDSRLDWRFLDLRHPKQNLIFRLQTTIEQSMRSFWMERGFIELHSPKLMETASESGAELFKVEYFGRTAYLAQSPQFYKQMAMAAGFDRVFEIGPVFRANPSFTSRHDTEFTSVDVEMAWISSYEELMAFEEEWIHHFLKEVQRVHGAEIAELFGIEVVVPTLPFPRVTMDEAYQILAAVGHDLPRRERGDLDPEGERLLAQHVREVYGHDFVFVTEYPSSVRPFYHMRYPSDPTKTKSFDLIWRGLEVTSGAQREHRRDVLIAQAQEKGIDLGPISHYLDFFRFGCPPHGGFGFGLTRSLMLILGIKNVREVTYLYRGPNRLSP